MRGGIELQDAPLRDELRQGCRPVQSKDDGLAWLT
jgi:hypothetical protein